MPRDLTRNHYHRYRPTAGGIAEGMAECGELRVNCVLVGSPAAWRGIQMISVMHRGVVDMLHNGKPS